MRKHLTNYRSASATLAVAAIAVVSACGGSDEATDTTEAAVSAPASEEAATATATDLAVTVPDTAPETTPTVEDTVAPDTAPTTETEADPDDEQAGIEETSAPDVAQGQMIANCEFGNLPRARRPAGSAQTRGASSPTMGRCQSTQRKTSSSSS